MRPNCIGFCGKDVVRTTEGPKNPEASSLISHVTTFVITAAADLLSATQIFRIKLKNTSKWHPQFGLYVLLALFKMSSDEPLSDLAVF